ncbi:hypothetical protein [Paraburkholderia sp. BCC1885]|uniref:hypothetical protein n=1 Tax=Paraburkholderia sp. BCC1885 TaxID=2562669 RepID=UPI001182F927|nr:hypothetical protein [Paraburkholderia sp. BCC1885]
MNHENEKLLLELDSFRFGMLAALHSLKASLQESPHFNQTVLEDAITFFLAQPASRGDRGSFESPLRALLTDETEFLKAILQKPQS